MKIAIMSDSHDSGANLQKAVQISNQSECEVLLFAGDLIAPPMLQYLEEFPGSRVVVVWGNNEGEKMALTRKIDASEKLELAGGFFEEEIGGVRIFMNHYPKYVELAAKTGDYDLCIYGHDHTYHLSQVGNTTLLNPGEIQGAISTPSFVIFDTQTRQANKIELD